MAGHGKGAFLILSIFSFLFLLSIHSAQCPTAASAHVVKVRRADGSVNIAPMPDPAITSPDKPGLEDPKQVPADPPANTTDPAAEGTPELIPIANEHMLNHEDVLKGQWIVSLKEPENYPELPFQSEDQRDTWTKVDFKKLLSDHLADAKVSEDDLKDLVELPMTPGYSAAIEDPILDKIRSNTKFANMVEVNLAMHQMSSPRVYSQPSLHEKEKRASSLQYDTVTKNEVGYNLAMIAEPKFSHSPTKFREISKGNWQNVRLKDAGKGVKVWVIDGGIVPDHPEFLNAEGKSRVSQKDISITIPGRPLPFPSYDLVHGTFVAGIVGGRKVGVAPGVDLVDVKLHTSKYSEYLSALNAVLEDVPSTDRRFVLPLNRLGSSVS